MRRLNSTSNVIAPPDMSIAGQPSAWRERQTKSNINVGNAIKARNETRYVTRRTHPFHAGKIGGGKEMGNLKKKQIRKQDRNNQIDS